MSDQKFHVCIKCGRKRPERYLVLLGSTWNGQHWICNPALEARIKNGWRRNDRYCDNLAKPGNFYEKLRTWCKMLNQLFPDLAGQVPDQVKPVGSRKTAHQVGKADIRVSAQDGKTSSKRQPVRVVQAAKTSRPAKRLPGQRQPGRRPGAKRK